MSERDIELLIYETSDDPQRDLARYAHDVGGACGASDDSVCDYCGEGAVNSGYTGTDKYLPVGVVHEGEGLMPGSYFGLPGIVHYTGVPTLENIDGHWPTREAWEKMLDDNE